MAHQTQIPTLAGAIVSKQQAFLPLSVDDAQWVIENAEEAIALAVKAIMDRNKTPISSPIQSPIQKRTLDVWKTIQVGGMPKDKLVASVKNESSNWAKDIMGKPAFTVAEKQEPVDLVSISLRNLRFTESPRTDEFMTARFCADWSAKHLDGQVIELCASEDGPQLRRQYEDQPKGECVWMAMERITASDGYPDVFSVKHDGDGTRWLDGRCANPGRRWDLDDRIVFRLRKITKP